MRSAAAFAFALLMPLGGAAAKSVVITKLWSFASGFNFCYPGGVSFDKAGNLYGTTFGCPYGTVYELKKNGAFKVLRVFDFTKDHDYPPQGNVVVTGDGSIYGITRQGGASDTGRIFKLTPTGEFKVLHEFTGGGDGAYPQDGMTLADDGNLYGLTEGGGTGTGFDGGGVVYKIAPGDVFSVVHALVREVDGYQPFGRLLAHGGNLYGMAYTGGPKRQGTAFKIAPDGTFAVLHVFDPDAQEGFLPQGPPIADGNGNLYGITREGGANGAGTIFQLAPDGTQTTLYSLRSPRKDGYYPNPPMMLKGRTLFGLMQAGGLNGQGIAFRLKPDHTYKVVYRFFQNDGNVSEPSGGLVKGPDGAFYSTSLEGGDTFNGTIFKLEIK